MEKCPPADVIAAFASRRLSVGDSATVREHLSDCSHCQESVAHLAEGSSPLVDGDTLAAVSGSGGVGAEPGATIGPYRLLRKIGEGGMGEVWEADQLAPVRRRVALKLIKAGMDTREIIARFNSERQALALMQHPSIAQIFDAGTTPDGRPYFAMELVDGVPVTHHCDEQRLDVSARLRLFQQICDAVQHAHRKGVIHRDLKPSNVLVTVQAGVATPKVIDFGLAKATAGELGDPTQTELGLWVGTPAYASPEQMQLVDGGVDTRSDVYSLAMLLYELLVGALPFDVGGPRPPTAFELRRLIWEGEFARPSARFAALTNRAAIAEARRTDAATLRRRLNGDLDWIALKGISRDPAGRYGSVDELSADLAHHLRDEPVIAGPPSRAYRAGKFVRRHRVGVAAANGLLLLIVGIAVTMAVQARSIAGERDRAEAEAAKAAAVTAFLQETIGAADPWQTGRDMSVRETLSRAAARVDSSFQGQPLVAAAVRRAIGTTFMELGKYDDAALLFKSALAARVELLGAEHADVGESHADLAMLLQRNGKLEEAETHDRAGLAIRRARFGARHATVADSLEHLSQTLYLRGEYDASARAGEESLAIREALFGPNSTEVSDSLTMLAAVTGGGQGDNDKSEAQATRAVEIRRAVSGPDHPRTADAMNSLAVVRHSQGKLDDAVALYRDVLRIDRAELDVDHPNTAIAMENLGGVLLAEKRYDETLALLGEVLAIRRAKLGADSPIVTRTMLNIATTEMRAGHLEAAEAGYTAALPRIRAEMGDEHPDVAATLYNLALLRVKQGHDADAENLFRQALAIRVRKMPPTHPDIAKNQVAIARLLGKRKQFDEAEKLMLAGKDVLEKALGKDAVDTRSAVDALAALYDAWGKPDEAARIRAGVASGPSAP
jgi:eukaryotic-like serine/threonine-protein kinase